MIRRPHSDQPDDYLIVAFTYNELSLVNAALEVAMEKLGDWNGPEEYLSMAEDMKPLLTRLERRLEEFE